MKGIIKTPQFLSGYTVSGAVSATIDESTNTLITHHEDNDDKTYKYHSVGRYDFFTFIKYIVLPYFLLTLDIWRMNIHSGLFWIAAAITIVVWHKYGRREEKIIKMRLFAADVALFISLVVVGVINQVLNLSLSFIIGAICGVILYEIALAIVSQEWQFLRKVYIFDNNRIFAHYFKMPESPESITAEKVAIKKISAKIYFVIAIMTAIGLTDIATESIQIYKQMEAREAAIVAQKEQDNLELKMNESDARGDTQIVTTALRVVQKPDIEKINNLLNIPPEYNITKTKTYPWQVSYQHGGEWFYRDGQLISGKLTGGKK